MHFDHNFLVASAWDLLEQRGLNGLSADSLSQLSGIPLTDVLGLCPTPVSILLLLWNDIEEKAATQPAHNLSVHDYLFESLMNHLDQALSHKVAINRVLDELLLSPCWVVDLKPQALKWSRSVLMNANADLGGLLGEIKPFVFGVFCLYVLKVWGADQTLDHSETMAKLDLGLRKLEEWQSWCW
ncbi:MAG: hypothetical protein NTX76_03180 [Alphaproteobacteria bacterium]|nr:hypothetical protein [Alphaproteobacteria bacterium]